MARCARPKHALILLLVLSLLVTAACRTPNAEAGHGSIAIRELVRHGPIAVPDTTDATDWLTRPSRLLRDQDSGNLLTLNTDAGTLVEFTMGGELVRTVGKSGQGPGEIRLGDAFAFTPTVAVILDVGNGKIAIFDRYSGEIRTEIPLGHIVYDIATIGDSLIATLPGGAGAAFALYTLDGELVGRYAHDRIRQSCRGCLVVDVGNEQLVVTEVERPASHVFTLAGEQLRVFEYEKTIPEINMWRREFADLVGIAGDRAPTGKLFMFDSVPAGEGRFLLTVVPEKVRERGRELWLVDATDGVIERYRYEDVDAGTWAVAAFPSVFAHRIDDFGIYEYRLDTGVGGTRKEIP